LAPAGEVEKLGGEVESGRSIWMRCQLSQMAAGWEMEWEWEMGGRMMGEQGLGEEVLPPMVLEWAETSV